MLRTFVTMSLISTSLLSWNVAALVGEGCYETFTKTPARLEGQPLPGVVVCVTGEFVAIIAPNDGPVAFCEKTNRVEQHGLQTVYYFENGDTMIFEVDFESLLAQGRFIVGSTEANFIQVGMLATQSHREKILKSGTCH